MTARDLTALVHIVGFATGIMLYAMLAMMARRRLRYVGAASVEERRVDNLPLVTAILGTIWNVGAMIVYAISDFGIGDPLTWVSAISYTALGFLPAVVVHSTLNRSGSKEHAWLVRLAYIGSGVAGVMHAVAAAQGQMLSVAGLLLLTMTYAAVLGVLAITERKRPGFQRTITAVALAAFAVSALHLSRHPGLVDADPWPIELIGHHASLPLVLAILYQDYRFAFADLFLKRALSLLVLVGVVALLYATVAAPFVDPHAIAARQRLSTDSHLFSTGALLGLWIATALAYPLVQRRVFRFVDRVILRRPDYRRLRMELATSVSSAHDVEGALGQTGDLLARALDASAVEWRVALSRDKSQPTIALHAHRAGATVTVPTAVEPCYEILIHELRGGGTLLSDDMVFIEAVASTLGRRIDVIRLDAERVSREQRELELVRLTTETELRALRAQLNPHFLFNALNTLGHLMQTAPDRATATLYRLTALLRAVLRRTNGQFVSLREELDIIEAYLAIERERFEERLAVTIDVPDELKAARIPPLILQPLVENAVKHGIAPLRRGGTVTVRAERDLTDDRYVRLSVIDTGRGMSTAASERQTGVGLSNIESRLGLYFGSSASVCIHPTPGGGTTVEICLPWLAAAVDQPSASIRSA